MLSSFYPSRPAPGSLFDTKGSHPAGSGQRQEPPQADAVLLPALPAALLFMCAGLAHFVQPAPFIQMMAGLPLPRLHRTAVFASGALEFLLGFALIFLSAIGASQRGVDKIAWMLFCLAITPANINMFLNDVPFGEVRFTPAVHAGRFGAQIVLLSYLWWLSQSSSRRPKPKTHQI